MPTLGNFLSRRREAQELRERSHQQAEAIRRNQEQVNSVLTSGAMTVQEVRETSGVAATAVNAMVDAFQMTTEAVAWFGDVITGHTSADIREHVATHLRGGTARGTCYTTEYTNSARRLVTSAGGYNLLIQNANSDIQLNLSRAVSLEKRTEDSYRDQAAAVMESMGIPFIPIAEASTFRLNAPTRKLVHRQGYEAVFSVVKGEQTEFYLSAYDTQESPPLYFLCQLPRPVATVDEAREALKPDSVLRAEKAGLEVKRQGDLFAIASSLTDDQLRDAGGKIFPDPIVEETLDLYGTNHQATRTCVMPSGLTLGSGRLVHVPRGRPPDHHPCTLSDGWWFIAKNAVPIGPRPPVRNSMGPNPLAGWVRPSQRTMGELAEESRGMFQQDRVVTWQGTVVFGSQPSSPTARLIMHADGSVEQVMMEGPPRPAVPELPPQVDTPENRAYLNRLAEVVFRDRDRYANTLNRRVHFMLPTGQRAEVEVDRNGQMYNPRFIPDLTDGMIAAQGFSSIGTLAPDSNPL